MAILFFSLRGVPIDEADDIRQLLSLNDIDFYETSAGNWGISTPAIWLYHREDQERIQQQFDEYQQQRTIRQRELYLEAKQHAENTLPLRRLMQRSVQIILSSSVIGVVLYISFKWLFELGF